MTAPRTKETRRAWLREARSPPTPFEPAENTIRVLVALGSQPFSVRCRLGSMAFHSPPTLARIGEAYSCLAISPSGLAHVVERRVRSVVTSTGFPDFAARAIASPSSTCLVCRPRPAASSPAVEPSSM